VVTTPVAVSRTSLWRLTAAVDPVVVFAKLRGLPTGVQVWPVIGAEPQFAVAKTPAMPVTLIAMVGAASGFTKSAMAPPPNVSGLTVAPVPARPANTPLVGAKARLQLRGSRSPRSEMKRPLTVVLVNACGLCGGSSSPPALHTRTDQTGAEQQY
jgi:hypothetical protein